AGPEVAVSRPGWAYPNVSDVLPRLALDAVGPGLEVHGLHAGEIVPLGLVGHPLDLHGLLVVPPHDNRHPGIAAEVLHLARRAEGIKDDLQIVARREADDCR